MKILLLPLSGRLGFTQLWERGSWRVCTAALISVKQANKLVQGNQVIGNLQLRDALAAVGAFTPLSYEEDTTRGATIENMAAMHGDADIIIIAYPAGTNLQWERVDCKAR